MVDTTILSSTEYNDIISAIVEKNNNDLITLVVLLIIGFIIAFIPFYTIKRKSVKDKTESEMAERKLLIEVISKNSEVISGLKNTMESNNSAMTSLLSSIQREIIDLNRSLLQNSSEHKIIFEKLNENLNAINNVNSKMQLMNEDNKNLSEFIKNTEHAIDGISEDLEDIKKL